MILRYIDRLRMNLSKQDDEEFIKEIIHINNIGEICEWCNCNINGSCRNTHGKSCISEIIDSLKKEEFCSDCFYTDYCDDAFTMKSINCLQYEIDKLTMNIED